MQPMSLQKFTRLARLLLVAALLAGIGPPAIAAERSADAETFVADLADQVIAVSREVATDPAAHVDELTRLLDRSTDVRLVGRLVLGKVWRSASEAQRQEYLALFRDYVLAGLVRRLGGATGIERVEITGSRKLRGEDSMVATRVVLGKGGPPTNVEWRVRHSGDRHQVIDVVVEGVSLVVTNRNEFGAIASQRGMAGLLDQLREWRALPTKDRPAA